MTDREKLVELLDETENQYLEAVSGADSDSERYKIVKDAYGFYADHLLANGVIVLPCKVGDTVWDREVEPWTVFAIECFARKVFHIRCTSPVTGRRATFSIGKRSIGKTVFLTREEAEKALAERIEE